jgi:cytosol alanyl aminopeptidase
MRAPMKLAFTLLVALAACAGEQPAPVAPPAKVAPAPPPPPPAAREDGRLPELAKPERYALSFTVDPAQPEFSGTVRILVTVPAPTSYIVLHGRGLSVQTAAATALGASVPATVTARPASGGHDNEELVLAFASPLPAGRTTLTIDYRAPFTDSLAGLYRVMEDHTYYAFTQFEANDARRAFPCFDEPGYKVSFDLSITVPKGQIAVANMPETARRESGDQTTFQFASTPPLPTYLVAFAVGDFDVRQGATAPVPIRLITTKGRSGMGDLALQATDALTRELAGYFGIAYPYPKLDIVAVPNFAAGAMENAGLITFRDWYLLLDQAHPSAATKREQALVIAHELAHQWFGDLVTMAWWNDVWLNEGFATWAEAKIADRYKPSLEARVEQIAEVSSVMDTDSLRSARAVRQPVKSSSEAEEAFDSLTYQKGARVLAMIEHSIGEGVFQKAVRAYLTKHAWKNATADDLLQALNEASGKDVSSLASSFLDRPGVPQVSVSVACNKTGATVSLAQSSWLRLGEAAAPTTGDKPWWVPVGLTSATGERAAKLLAGPKDEVLLGRCTPWVFPNTDLAGYYRFSLDEKAWVEMSKGFDHLDVPARVGFLANLWAQTRAGALDPSVVLRTLPVADGEKDRYVIEQEIEILKSMDSALVADDTAAAFRRYAAFRLLPHSRLASAKHDEEATLLQRALLPALGDIAGDDATFKEAERVTQAWLKDPDSVDPDLARVDVMLASRRAGPDRLEALRKALAGAKNPENAEIAVRALGAFSDASTLEKALDLMLTDEIKTQDTYKLVGATLAHKATRKVSLEWAAAHWDGLKKKIPTAFMGDFLAMFVGSDCAADERSAATAFLSPHIKEVEGAERPVAEASESATLCEALHDKYTPSVSHFFAGGAPAAPPKAALVEAPKAPPVPALAPKAAVAPPVPKRKKAP